MSRKSDNEKTVLDYFDLTFSRRDPANAAVLFLHEDYYHHGDGSGPSRQDFVEYFSSFFRSNPEFKADVLQCVSDDEMVVLRIITKESPDTDYREVAEFYRLEFGKIREHWHVIASKPL
jgi:predicted SnoaL-like aldol condensation-catalyzing enzyme